MTIYRKFFPLFLSATITTSYADDGKDQVFLRQLTNCAAFFGILSQANTEQAAQFKSMTLLLSSYAMEIASPSEIDDAITASRKIIAEIVENAPADDRRDGVNKQFSMCMATLKKSEIVLRPRMSEFNKSLTPEIFQ